MKNKRLISLLNTLTKVVEKLVKEELDDQVETRVIEPPNQFGFRRKLVAMQT